MITRRKVTISLRQDLYDELKKNQVRISTLINKLVEDYFENQKGS